MKANSTLKTKSTLLESFLAEEERGLNGQRLCCVVNLSQKRILWEELFKLWFSIDVDFWCVLGDFNSPREAYERKGSGLVDSDHSPMLLNASGDIDTIGQTLLTNSLFPFFYLVYALFDCFVTNPAQRSLPLHQQLVSKPIDR
ncbi:hypothetical protein Lal_00000896 [Lupinus albus]|nr:hypothetical protein Lal_00000896 [Lupinus albus]